MVYNIIVQQGRNNAPVFKSIRPFFFSGSANYKQGHYFCLDVIVPFIENRPILKREGIHIFL